jgi:hypothetical protein
MCQLFFQNRPFGQFIIKIHTLAKIAVIDECESHDFGRARRRGGTESSTAVGATMETTRGHARHFSVIVTISISTTSHRFDAIVEVKDCKLRGANVFH